MIRSLLIAVIASAAGAAAVGLIYGAEGAVTTFYLVAPVAVTVLLIAHWAARHRARIGGISRQLALAILLVVASILVTVWIGADRMFLSDHDAAVISLMAAVIGLVALRVGQVLHAGIAADVDRIRAGLERIGEGDRAAADLPVGPDELGEIAADITSMTSRLAAEERRRDEAETARRDLVAAVSHDLRTPIASLRLMTEAIADGVATGETRERYLSELRLQVRTLGDLVDDLFELSRIEAEDINWVMGQIELEPLLNETVDVMRVQGEARGVNVVAELSGEPVAARANPEKVQRVLFNLIQNAIRYTPADGSVTVRARHLDGQVAVEVEDNGTGIDGEDAPHVFEPFFRGGPDTSRSSDGSGLGLALSRAIVEAHGGRIWFESTGSGTVMRFTLQQEAAA
ncbi:MAG: HAMP domain-containing histidine kinase [Solirubrobacterales bacterium]|nr:HAMP domain-containing histidine kinase [Solirubrobacterales bacterium]MCB8916056.1 HAMP domain-containing histidine kinase [Thermoleophilales bacterium]